jgi:glycosyltransferase involved in cell wall biosynthesis
MVSQENSTSAPYRMLVVDLEPTPYKTDLWNAFSDSRKVEISVIYTERKNWAPDGGHNYVRWPAYVHDHVVLSGQGPLGRLQSAIEVAKQIFRSRVDLICIAGYDRLATVTAILSATLTGQRFVVHADQFNNQWPKGRLALLKLMIRELLRKIVFLRGDAVLVCGKRGIASALTAGCLPEKVLDFPYVVDAQRMRVDDPKELPTACQEDLDENRLVIFFSGRMIPRKGLPTLLMALTHLQPIRQAWTLWIEGDGPKLSEYLRLAQELNLDGSCRFLGFCQYDVHSWLVRSSDIVVVPSLEDPWGIVVDEGLQLGKAVVSSDATGSGYDRIETGYNGYLFPAGDELALARCLDALIDDRENRLRLGSIAEANPRNLGPRHNLETLLRLASKKPSSKINM